ncbi:MAG: 4-amino-4-deoxy-L-arabinose transferase [Anaerolineae bacterium]|jgi:multidrug transporter EmrE-like cation transporter|nr:4-amino-4-deoxy-L-arabinose transferase [Ardenticatenia bacterium]MBK8539945.1 4-amino-4-deoxy-L-arabinose transferase [Ardenticatenia bacterium]HQZ69756.1 4-amino-4-deoxy-L-arabinose transferase [Anaerolineae bacterium]
MPTDHRWGSFALLLTAIAIGQVAEFLMKHGTNQLGGEMQFTLPGLWKAFTIPALTGGYGMAFVAALFWTRVLSREPLSWAYPLLALGYLPLLLGAHHLLGETISPLRILGVVVIIAGVAMVFRS